MKHLIKDHRDLSQYFIFHIFITYRVIRYIIKIYFPYFLIIYLITLSCNQIYYKKIWKMKYCDKSLCQGLDDVNRVMVT